jgi:hypothetical protein
MRTALKRLFPNLYPVMAAWPVEKWMLLPVTLMTIFAVIGGLTVAALGHSFWSDPGQ